VVESATITYTGSADGGVVAIAQADATAAGAARATLERGGARTDERSSLAR
jgi:hypothetical protein